MVYDSLDLPGRLRTERNAYSALMLVQSQKLTRKRVLLPRFKRVLDG